MFGLTEHHQYHLYTGVADMRKGFNGLSGIILDRMNGNPLDGNVYIFVNRRRNLIKLLLWESSGFILYYKRLEQGTFELPRVVKGGGGRRREIKWETLMLMISGISLQKIQHRKRYKKVV